MLVSSKVDEKEGLVQVELQAPSGYYDQYTINLIEMCSAAALSSNTTVLFSKNFTVDSSLAAVDSKPRRLEFLILNTAETLKSGCQYEMTTSVQRRAVRALKFNQIKSNVKLNAFSVRPEPIQSVLYFVKSNSSANVTWQQPLMGVYRAFAVRHYSPRATTTTNTNTNKSISQQDEQITAQTWFLIQDLAIDRAHLVEVKSCADAQCHVFSEPMRFALELAEKRIISQLVARNSSTNRSVENNTHGGAGLELTWRVHPESESDLCDLSSVRISWTTYIRHGNRTQSMVVPASQACPRLKCGPLSDDATSSGIECRHDLDNLKFNTPYFISIALVALSGSYEWPPSASLSDIKTTLSIPRGSIYKTAANYDVNANIKSYSAISIVEPLIDQSAGPVIKSRLYLIKLDSLAQHQEAAPNRTTHEMFRLVSTTDQDYLRQLVALSSTCTNTTMLLEPCLLAEKPYERTSSTTEKIVLIGRLASNENASLIFQKTMVIS